MSNEVELSEDDPVVTAASQWLVLRDRGMKGRDRNNFEAWLKSDPKHAAVYAEMEEAWGIMGAASAPELTMVAEGRGRKRAVFLRWVAPLGAAAAVAVGYWGWWVPTKGSYVGTVQTAVGGLERIKLPDGSVAVVNTDSVVEVDYSGTSRRVKLTRGEAHFTVAKNASRPFVVVAAGVDVQALGTAFSVRIREGAVDVLVTDGKVRVDGEAARALSRADALEMPASRATPVDTVLQAGEMVSVSLMAPVNNKAELPPAVAIVKVPQVAVDQALAWRDRQLQFSTETLEEMVAEFNRYNKTQLVVADPALAKKRFGGTFPANDSESFVELLKNEYGVAARKDMSGRVTLKLTD